MKYKPEKPQIFILIPEFCGWNHLVSQKPYFNRMVPDVLVTVEQFGLWCIQVSIPGELLLGMVPMGKKGIFRTTSDKTDRATDR